MSKQDVILNFENGFSGEIVAKNATVAIGGNEGQLRPYDMYLGALGSCFYSTFIDIIEKKRISIDKVTIHLTGEKRNEIPAYLKWVNLDITVYNPSDEKGLDKAAKLAGKYCSVYQTTAKVADMSWKITVK
ncbi:MAG: OsmC family protein [Clostridia bacterium]